MRVTKAKVAEHRRAILDSASRLFRERGFREVGVAEIMQASGLTHGAFYGHFRSKAELADHVCQEACANGALAWLKSASLTEILDRYLTPAHRDNPAAGCALAALGAEVARQSGEVQKSYAEGTGHYVDALERHMDDAPPEARRKQAMAVLSCMVGALTLARGVASGDPALSDAILAAAREQLRSHFGA
ncbi:TetR/AcrR family transcriptional regulator [Ancylobacter vacuolatus]|uniref:TetR/AcrR family transcriptional repressor of nem operon n=1 Tax=Ancylobacter vacuolatus TaxID=223389 RepID=A0ABU0DIZ6_9HYPH|nr:TetR family transcriptional regulator [Ancylobacter vacuolatus]MDQ0348398.1 TetR/AcrR family transcriptional repressor of nem operon [Ancylobacter vacuolatus]